MCLKSAGDLSRTAGHVDQSSQDQRRSTHSVNVARVALRRRLTGNLTGACQEGDLKRKANRPEDNWQSLHDELNRIRSGLDSREIVDGAAARSHPELMPYYERLTENGLRGRRSKDSCLRVQNAHRTRRSDTAFNRRLQHTIAGRSRQRVALMEQGRRKEDRHLGRPHGGRQNDHDCQTGRPLSSA